MNKQIKFYGKKMSELTNLEKMLLTLDTLNTMVVNHQKECEDKRKLVTSIGMKRSEIICKILGRDEKSVFTDIDTTLQFLFEIESTNYSIKKFIEDFVEGKKIHDREIELTRLN